MQHSSLFSDCKTFVDMPMRFDPEEVRANFERLPRNPTDEELRDFVEANFLPAGIDLQHSEPVDFVADPPFARRINSEGLREFAYYIHSIWPQLFRRVDPDVRQHQQRHSLLALDYPVVVPGGRFRESYYWDSYWIVEGLLVSGLHMSARGVIKNLLSYIESFGFVPNGGRCYYMDRSQPPMLSEMILAYYKATGDVGLLRHALPLLDREYAFWMSSPEIGHLGHSVTLTDADGRSHVLNKYMSTEATPRPESYREDIELVDGLDAAAAGAVWCHIRAAAESGWDFSSRWMGDGKHLVSTRTTEIVPVGLNAMMLRFEGNMAALYAALAHEDVASGADLAYAVSRYTAAKEQRREAMQALMWWEAGARWRDYDTASREQVTTPSSASSWLPLWAECLPSGSTAISRSIAALEDSGLLQPGGVQTTTTVTGQQWDAPNAWPPLQHLLIEGLQRSGLQRGRELAQVLAAMWIGTSFVSWRRTGFMHEKYNAQLIGESGGGGEYTPQTGFGWTNGVVLKLLDTYGHALDLTAGEASSSALYVQHPLLRHWLDQPEAVLPRQLTSHAHERLADTTADRGRTTRQLASRAVEAAKASLEVAQIKVWEGLTSVPSSALDGARQLGLRLRAAGTHLWRGRPTHGRDGRRHTRSASLSRVARREQQRRAAAFAAQLAFERRLSSAVRQGWLICQTRPYMTSWRAFTRSGDKGVDWRELSGRKRGRQSYQFGDLTRLTFRQVRGRAMAAPTFKYAIVDASGALTLYEPMRPPESTDAAPLTLEEALSTGSESACGLRLDSAQVLQLRGAAVRTLWPDACVNPVQAAEECILPDEETAAAVTEANAKEMAARSIRQVDNDGRTLHTFTIASSAIGTEQPKTWRLAAHDRDDAEGWAESLVELSSLSEEEQVA